MLCVFHDFNVFATVNSTYKIPQKGVIDWLLRENYRGAAVF